MNQDYKQLRENAIARLLDQPDAYLIIEKINDLLRDEQILLSNFYINNLNGEKSEFINGSIIPIRRPPRKKQSACFLRGYLMNS
ncbi:hypothetical protein LXM25_14725 [Dyadobacter sp. LJ53]|uniref:hypothetical protein n=1 Tax=Dyadobacter chenwenxiniae TaxID=2906456 RepID=UPI001F27CEB5|nr:hypothetical protein [Dyadobacter chenwenxiniae]MCF0051322.1 hypothetical protein [Dyadobacter chenwenxiniae]